MTDRRTLRVAAIAAAIDAECARSRVESFTRRARNSRSFVVRLVPILAAREVAARLSERHRALFAALPVDDRNVLRDASLPALQATLTHLTRGQR